MFFAFLQQTSFKVNTSITSQQNNPFLNLWSSFASVWLHFHAIETIIISLQVTLYLPNQVDFSMLKKKKESPGDGPIQNLGCLNPTGVSLHLLRTAKSAELFNSNKDYRVAFQVLSPAEKCHRQLAWRNMSRQRQPTEPYAATFQHLTRPSETPTADGLHTAAGC